MDSEPALAFVCVFQQQVKGQLSATGFSRRQSVLSMLVEKPKARTAVRLSSVG